MALFGRKAEKRVSDSSGIYLLMDSNSRMLGRGKRMDAPGRKNIYIKLIEGNVKALVDAGILQAVPVCLFLPHLSLSCPQSPSFRQIPP